MQNSMEVLQPKHPFPSQETISDLFKLANDAAVEGGWRDKPMDDLRACILISGELTGESYEELRADKDPGYVYYIKHATHVGSCIEAEYPYTEDTPVTCKPEGFLFELADVVIRGFDHAGRRGASQIVISNGYTYCHSIDSYITNAMTHLFGSTKDLADRLGDCLRFVLSLMTCFGDHPPEWYIRKKIAHNRTRGYRHGGKAI